MKERRDATSFTFIEQKCTRGGVHLILEIETDRSQFLY
jgi:hypothetical protein